VKHLLIVGITGTGKTILAKRLTQYSAVPALIYDPFVSEGWKAQKVTDNIDEFAELVHRSQHCLVIIDEAPEALGRSSEFQSLATLTRHYGHTVILIAQRAMQLTPTVRSQCGRIAAFKQSSYDARILATEYADDTFLAVNTLRSGVYAYKGHPDTAVKFFALWPLRPSRATL